MYYITSSSPTYDGTTILRSAPNTGSSTVGDLNTLGFKCYKEDTTGVNSQDWTKYVNDNYPNGFWVRNDSHKSSIVYPNRILTSDNVFSTTKQAYAALLTMYKYYNNDTKVTLEDIENVVGNKTFEINDLLFVSAQSGFSPVYKRPYHLPDIFESINNDKPVLLVVNNAQLYANKNYINYVVVVGYDDNYLYVQNPEQNQNYTIHKYTKFNKAIGQYQNESTIPFQAIYFEDKLPNDESLSKAEQIDLYIAKIREYMVYIDTALEKIEELKYE